MRWSSALLLSVPFKISIAFLTNMVLKLVYWLFVGCCQSLLYALRLRNVEIGRKLFFKIEFDFLFSPLL